jgi:plastocyanin
MTAIDKAAIAWTIAIVVVGVAIAGMGGQLQSTSVTQAIERETSMEKAIETKEKLMEESMEKQKEMIEPKVTPEPEVVEEPEPEVMEEPEPEVMTGPVTVEVSLPSGTSVPGCEETNACYVPATVSINVGDTVSWSNDDTAAHTVTGGSATTGPSGAFDSSLLIAGGTFEHTFDSSGTEDYYCMVHPWMTGSVKVS